MKIRNSIRLNDKPLKLAGTPYKLSSKILLDTALPKKDALRERLRNAAKSAGS